MPKKGHLVDLLGNFNRIVSRCSENCKRTLCTHTHTHTHTHTICEEIGNVKGAIKRNPGIVIRVIRKKWEK
jgi:Fe2+ or Zn2+ uptake regulation protein